MTQENMQGSDPQAQSSSMVALRTLVMIVFLVAVPLIAVLGTGLPGSLRTAMQGRAAGPVSEHPAPRTGGSLTAPPELAGAPPANDGPANHAGRAKGIESEASPTEVENPARAPHPAGGGEGSPSVQAATVERFPERSPRASITAVRTEPSAPRARITEVRTLPDAASASAPLATAPFWAPAPRTASTPRGRDTTAHFESSDSGLSGPMRKPERKVADESPWQATAYSRPATRGGPGAAAPVPSGPEHAAPTDAFARGERRLKELGASHYRLETWGERGELFRCAANVRLPNSRRGMRHFEATAPAPSQAVEQLLAKVEAWLDAQR
ncbi:MAG TPA: hypothetical protein VGN42_17600 [Pirellulales bacterium]|nr:hypothetical protein [Pirellulales bacterium]